MRACREAIELARAIDDPYSLAVALAYGAVTHQMRHDLPELGDTVPSCVELCDRYDFAYYREWALILDGWSRRGRRRARIWPGGHQQPQVAGSVRAHAVLAVAARRPVRAGTTSPAPRAPPSTPPSPPGTSTTTCGGCPR